MVGLRFNCLLRFCASFSHLRNSSLSAGILAHTLQQRVGINIAHFNSQQALSEAMNFPRPELSSSAFLPLLLFLFTQDQCPFV
jgi:hypothetical protein